MTVYYMSFWNEGSAVNKKILSKIKYLNMVGQPCKGLFVTALAENDFPYHDNVIFIKLSQKNTTRIDWLFHLSSGYFDSLLSYVQEHLVAGDVVMHRFPGMIEFSFYKFIKALPVAIYVEHNTKEWDEVSRFGFKNIPLQQEGPFSTTVKKLLLNKWERLYYWYADNVWKKRIFQIVAKGICVCRDIASYEKRYLASYPTVIISNSIDVTSVPLRIAPSFDGLELRILMVSGWESEWLGLDLLIDSLVKYTGPVKITVDYCGEVFEKHKAKLSLLSTIHTIRFIGFSRGAAFDELFDKCHIAIGSLALYRLNLKDASNLKTREYMARGIPFVIGYADTDLVQDDRWAPYYLQVDHPERGILFEELIEFASRIITRDQHPQQMRALAMQTVHTPIKMNLLKQAIAYA